MNSDIDQLESDFRSGRLLRPDWSQPNPIALARAVSGLGGYSPWPDDAVTTQIRRRIGDPDHLVLVIADGFGMNLVRSLPESSFTRTHLVWEQLAAFPSSTGPNMTSLYSGEYPSMHGFPGWWVYLPQLGERATVYEWVRHSDRADLSSLGVKPRDVFLSEPFMDRLEVDSMLFMPSLIAGTVATRFSAAGTVPVTGFDGREDAVEKVVGRVRAAGSKTFTMLFWNRIDRSAHLLGTGAPETLELVTDFDLMLGDMAKGVEGKARLIVTADHGHLDVPKYVQLDPAHSLACLMKCTQSGDDRVSYFHIRDGQHERFAVEFRSQFGDDFFLLTTDELAEMRLLGPEPPTAAVRERLGDFIAISKQGVAFTSRSMQGRTDMHRSAHGGLSPEEMMVPVLLA